jgi:hypothetical protein
MRPGGDPRLMTDTNAHAHAADGMVGPHGSAEDHGDGHGHDDHAHAAAALGPIDLRAWGYGALGVVLGLVVAVVLASSAGLLGG